MILHFTFYTPHHPSVYSVYSVVQIPRENHGDTPHKGRIRKSSGFDESHDNTSYCHDAVKHIQ